MFRFRITKRKIQIAFIQLILITLLLYIYMFLKYQPPNMKLKSPGDGYSIKTIGCSIPSLNPYDSAILPYIFKNPPLRCSKLPALVTSEISTLYVNLSALPEYNVTNMDNFICYHQEIIRNKQPPGMYPELTNDSYRISPIYKSFKRLIKVEEEEFVRVVCLNEGKEIYKDFHAFIPYKKKTKTKKPSVLVVGIDSTSRANFLRQMPKTAAYLNDLNAVEFYGYNKVADNTFPNIVPALTGKTEFEFSGECLTSKWLSLKTKFDSCHFIWDDFKANGFLTALAEDSSWMGLFTSGHRYGFVKKPTDYYWNTFNYAAEIEMGTHPYDWDDIYLCVGPRHIYQMLLDYMRKFMYKLRNESYFGWFWACSLTHSEMNFASVSDDDYRDFFMEMNKTNVLNNTIVVFMSDHGPRSGDIMMTHQGFLESRLPFLYILVPSWFDQKYPIAAKNLRTNSKRLVTTFDIHETFKDLINLDNLTERTLDTRGISLFSPIPEKRNCASAGIPVHFCSCFRSVPVEKYDNVIELIASYVVNYINLKLSNYDSCDLLALDAIIEARLLVSEEFRAFDIILREKSKLYNYIITLSTFPGGAIFESTVRSDNSGNSNNFEIQGGITRLNKYGKDGDCIDNPNLRIFCYCRNKN